MCVSRMEQHCLEHAKLLQQHSAGLAVELAAVAEALLQAITAGQRVLTVGLGADAALAAYFAHLCVQGHARQRPPLAAWALDAQPADATALVRQLQALGQAGDVLLLLHAGALPVELGDGVEALSHVQPRSKPANDLSGVWGAAHLQGTVGGAEHGARCLSQSVVGSGMAGDGVQLLGTAGSLTTFTAVAPPAPVWNAPPVALAAAVAAAQEREMRVVALLSATCPASAALAAQLRTRHDVCLRLGASMAAAAGHVGVGRVVQRVRELQLLALHGVLDGLEAQLLGD